MVKFTQSGRVRTTPLKSKQIPIAPPPPPAVKLVQKPAPKPIVKQTNSIVKTSMGPPATPSTLKRAHPADETTINIDGTRPKKILKLKLYTKKEELASILRSPPNPIKVAPKVAKSAPPRTSPAPRQSPALSVPSPVRSKSSASPAPPATPSSSAKPQRKPLPDSVPQAVAAPHSEKKKSLIVKLKLPLKK